MTVKINVTTPIDIQIHLGFLTSLSRGVYENAMLHFETEKRSTVYGNYLPTSANRLSTEKVVVARASNPHGKLKHLTQR